MRGALTFFLMTLLVGCGAHAVSGCPADLNASRRSGQPSDLEASLRDVRLAHEQERVRLDALHAANERLVQEQAVERARLDQLRLEVAESEQRAREASEDAADQQCAATIQELNATVMSRVAGCSKSQADHHACRARRSNNAAVGTAAGCGLGIVLGAFTMGASLLMCGIGGAAGYASSAQCSVEPVCASEPVMLSAEMAARSMTALPMCGGSLGLQPRLASRSVEGIPAQEVVPGMTAAEIGIVPGDFIVRVGGNPTDSAHPLAHALLLREVSAPLVVELIRDGTRHRLTASPRVVEVLGVRPLPAAWTKEEVIVVSDGTMPNSLQAGDVIVSVGGSPAPNLEAARGAIRMRREGEFVPMEIERGEVRQVVEVPLRRRANQEEL